MANHDAPRAHALFGTLLFAAGCILGVAAVSAQEAAVKKGPDPLFASDTTLTLSLTANFRTLAKDRDTVSRKSYSAVLAYIGPDSRPVTLNVHLETRGHYRLKRSTCEFPPLRVSFDKTEVAGTLFEHQKSLKLVTHCDNSSSKAEQLILKEFLLYRVYHQLTDLAFLARLVKMTYQDSVEANGKLVKFGFFVEDDGRLAKRNGMKLAKVKLTRFDDPDMDHNEGNLLGMFQYFIGNTDWSLPFLHNIRILANETGTNYPVAYDFDWSGAVDASYARPDARLPIRTVRERLYRGPCLKEQDLTATLASFKAKKGVIYQLYEGRPDITADTKKSTLEYFDEFYHQIDDPKHAQEAFRVVCPR